MNKPIKPPVAAAIIVVVVALCGYLIYSKAVIHNKTMKTSEAVKMPGFREAMQKKWQEGKGAEGSK